MKTREKILETALSLFAERGFEAVSVQDIAGSVGIKAPSLYKHFQSKQDIFDSCVREFAARMEKVHHEIGLPGTENAAFTYESVSREKLIETSVALFLFYLRDSVAARFRKMLTVERYRNPKINALFEKIFIDGAINHEKQVFDGLIEKGVLTGPSGASLALRFYAPVFFLLQKYDMRPDAAEEALIELRAAVWDFCELHGGKAAN